MLKVFVELWPHGNPDNKKTLAVYDIANDGTGTELRGSYKARINPRNSWTEKVVENYPRKSYSVGKLIYLTLKYFYE